MIHHHIVIRPLDGFEECRAAARFQDRVWGEGFSERVPASLLKVVPRIGGVALGAFLRAGEDGEEGELVGLVFGITGVEEGRTVHWSDILGVDPRYRDQGVGRRLKWAQRQAAIAAGATRMYWTFDPLEARNAWVNLERLGAVVREYVPDMYGASDSPIHRGLGTDRLVALWSLLAPGVELRSPTADVPDPAPDRPGADDKADGWPEPKGIAYPRLTDQPVRVAIPSEIQALRDADPELAARWRERTREVLQPLLDSGAEIRGFERGARTCEYVVYPARLEDPSGPTRL